MIPTTVTDEMVEVVARAKWAHDCAHAPWDGAPDNVRDFYRNGARDILEAVAPLIAAKAMEDMAEVFFARLPDGTPNGRAYNSYRVAFMLRDRAAELREAGR